MYISSLAQPETKPTNTSQSTSPAKILLADDEPEVAEVIELMLLRCGYFVTVVNSGQEALDAFSAENYDLVITDMYMPDLSGQEVARAVKGSMTGVPVLLITGWALQIDPSDIDIDGMIAKPFTKETLSQHVTEVLSGKSKN
jgi:CheY-like chemotaxis protein